MTTTIVLADDHKILRDGLRVLVDRAANMEIIGEAKDGREAVSLALELVPNIVVMDCAMPELNGVEATRQILAERPEVKVLALSMHSDRRFITRMLQAGASGYLLKDCAFEELSVAIETVLGGSIYLSPSLMGLIVKDYLSVLAQEQTSSPSLSPREVEVLQLLAEGRSTKEIARVLQRSTKTVESHRRQIMEKLNLHSVAELTKYAIREGLTEA